MPQYPTGRWIVYREEDYWIATHVAAVLAVASIIRSYVQVSRTSLREVGPASSAELGSIADAQGRTKPTTSMCNMGFSRADYCFDRRTCFAKHEPDQPACEPGHQRIDQHRDERVQLDHALTIAWV